MTENEKLELRKACESVYCPAILQENQEKITLGEGYLIFSEPQETCLNIEVDKLSFSKDSVEIVTVKDVFDFFKQCDKIIFADKDREITFVKEVKTQK